MFWKKGCFLNCTPSLLKECTKDRPTSDISIRPSLFLSNFCMNSLIFSLNCGFEGSWKKPSCVRTNNPSVVEGGSVDYCSFITYHSCSSPGNLQLPEEVLQLFSLDVAITWGTMRPQLCDMTSDHTFKTLLFKIWFILDARSKIREVFWEIKTL